MPRADPISSFAIVINSHRKLNKSITQPLRVFGQGSGNRPADGVKYIGVGSSDASRPSKARHPVLNLGTFLSVGPFLPLASSRGTSASPLATRQNSPGIWTPRCCTIYAATTHTASIFIPTPLDNVIPLASLNHGN
jgi:hypothetical protein